MLTDDEISNFWFTLGGDFVSFARDIERAVLAKAGEQEPVGEWHCSKNNRADNWVKFADGFEPVRGMKLYAHPLPAQAVPEVTPEMLRAAQLNSELGAYACSNWSGAYDCITELFNVMLSAAPKP